MSGSRLLGVVDRQFRNIQPPERWPEELTGQTDEWMEMATDLVFPTLADVLSIHEDIVAEDPESEPGVRSPEAVQSALTYVSVGYFGEVPATIHEKAAHLMRLLVAEHPFVDGNKRTALNTVVVFYEVNGYEFEYGDASIRKLLRRFATDVDAVEMDEIVAYCREHTERAKE